MVALNTDYAPSKTSTRSQNRVGDFFCEVGQGVGGNRLASRIGTKEKTTYSYETASGLPVWPNRDPIGEWGGVNLYEFLSNNVVVKWDLLGLSSNECCGGKLMAKGEACCDDVVVYNPKTQECCSGKIIYATQHYCCKDGQKTYKQPRWIVKWNSDRKACLKGACDMTGLLPGLGGKGRKFGFNPLTYIKDLALTNAACIARANYCDEKICPEN